LVKFFFDKADEMVVGAKFSNIHGVNKNMTYVDLHRLDEFEVVELPKI